MTYSTSILARLGKEIFKKHPDLASDILKQLEPKRTDLTEIENYYHAYCSTVGTKQFRPGKPHAEKKKVFVAAMISMFSNQYGFNKMISNLFSQTPNITTGMIKESEFRYMKDQDFRLQVNQILNKIQ